MAKDRLRLWIPGIISGLLPEGKLKEFASRYFWKLYDPLIPPISNPFYALNEIITKAELLQDGVLSKFSENTPQLAGCPTIQPEAVVK